MHAENNLRSKVVHVSSSVARPPTPALTDFVLIPPLLALHADVSTRVFYSHWSAAMGEWAASGFPALIQAGSHAWIPASDAAVDDFVHELATAFDFAADRECGVYETGGRCASGSRQDHCLAARG